MARWKEIVALKGDKILWIMIIALMVTSVLLIYSSTGRLAYNKQDGNTLFYVGKQIAFLVGCFGVLFFMQVFSWKWLYKWAQPLLLIAGVLLLVAAFGGSNINGAGRWIKIPVVGLTFQPSEFAKIAIVIYMAKLLSDYQEERYCSNEILRQLWIPAGIIVLVFLDNFSTSVLITVVCFILLILGRLRWKLLAKMIGALVGLLGLVIVLGFTFPQVREIGRIGTIIGRLTEFVIGSDGNEEAKKGYSMQSNHACMAIAQGGLTGRGPGNSVQRNMLPHAYSDFIYAILIEEYSFFGGLLVLVFYLVILYRVVRVGQNSLKSDHLNPRGAPELFPALLAIGLGVSIVSQALFHMGVNTGALPVTGQTLPLISLGGTSLLFTSAALGIILNVAYTFSPEYQEKKIGKRNEEEEDSRYAVLEEEWENNDSIRNGQRRPITDENIDMIGEEGVLNIEEQLESDGREVLRQLNRRMKRNE